ncbi:MAG: hypothetical protein V2B20_21780 [Pseudomonadota bacterium]
MDNFRRTEAYGFSGFKGSKTKIDKGHETQFQLLTECLRIDGKPLMPFACVESVKQGGWVKVVV